MSGSDETGQMVGKRERHLAKREPTRFREPRWRKMTRCQVSILTSTCTLYADGLVKSTQAIRTNSGDLTS